MFKSPLGHFFELLSFTLAWKLILQEIVPVLPDGSTAGLAVHGSWSSGGTADRRRLLGQGVHPLRMPVPGGQAYLITMLAVAAVRFSAK